MNKFIIGHNFEIEAKELLKKYFDRVIWLSKNKHSTFDFKCFKNGNQYFGDAKLINFSIKPHLNNSQREADFVIAKIKGNIELIWKDSFKEKVWINCKKGTTIQISNELWEKLNKMKTSKERTFEDVLIRLIKLSKQKGEKTQ